MSDLSHAHSPIEHAVENLCGNLLKKSSEFWEDRNKAMIELTRLICKFEDASPTTLHEVFNINVYRALIEPVKQMILDLRSQQVRDTCSFLVHLSKITGGLMRFFLRDTFESIFIAAKVPNKVMSGYVDECIISILHYTTFKSAIPVIIGEFRESKSKAAREKCLVYVNTILSCWDLTEKEGDLIDVVIRLGLEDASMKGRELSREAFITFKGIFPEKAEKLKASLSSSVLSRVTKAEAKHEKKTLLASQQQLLEEEEELHQSGRAASPVISRSASDEYIDDIFTKSTPSAYRQPGGDQNNAVTSIQALIQGNMDRRFSINRDPSQTSDLEVNAGHSSGEYVDDNMNPIVVRDFSPAYENHDKGNVDSIDIPLYLEPQTPVESLSPHTSTWYEADQLSPLTMDNGQGRLSHENGPESPHQHEHSNHESVSRHASSQRKTISPTKSPPVPMPTKVKAASLSLDGHQREALDVSGIHVGMQVMMKDKQPALVGIVQFVGHTSFASGLWAGIRLEVPLGKNNGVVQGVRYFQCLPLHGLFVRPQQLVVMDALHTGRLEEGTEAIGESPVEITPQVPEGPPLPRRSLSESSSRTNAEKLRATLNIAHAMKVKISKEMHIINHQLQMVEEFESQVQGAEGVNQEDCTQFVQSLVGVMQEEETMCKEFQLLVHGQHLGSN